MWIEKPDKIGYWLFKGIRITRSKKYIATVAAPVQVKEDKGFPEWVVFYAGASSPYGISQHEGEWFWLGELLDDPTK